MSRISVVVPAYNEELLLPACLRSLEAQDYQGAFEVLIVDNGSTDGTAALARARGFRVVEEPRRGYACALARGFLEATGDVVATTDADSVVPRDWISRLAREYEDRPEVVAVGGDIVYRDPGCFAKLLTRGLIPLINRVDRKNPAGPHLWGANFSVRRSVFYKAGGWNPRFNLQTDTELSERLRRFGKVVLLEDLAVSTSSRRWNHSLLRSSFIFASNFLCFKTLHRPLWRAFPDIRDDSPGTWWKPARAGLVAASIVMLTLLFGYETFTPWSNAFGKTYWSGATKRRVVALTFDDGPDEPSTSSVLSILRQEGVKATFFLVGENVRRYPEVAQQITRDGHAVGNHSDSHHFGFALQNARLQSLDLIRAENTIHDATGVYPRLFRPPQGIRSPWLMGLLKQDSLVAVTWDDAPGDWNRMTSKQVADRAVARAHPGAIILLHDGLHESQGRYRAATIEALPGIIHRLRAKGYTFVTLPEMLQVPESLHDALPPDSRAIAEKL